jgi:hypothetical protein
MPGYIYQDYSVNKDLSFIAERTSNTKVGSVSLLRRYDKLWMNRRVRSVNLSFDRALMEHSMSHINVTDTGTILRKQYTQHMAYTLISEVRWGLHIAESIRGGYVPNMNSSIPTTIHARASPFLG